MRCGGPAAPGTAGYDPDMLVTLLICAYANGVTSSRRIEAACHTDVAFRVICAGDVPDHVTIARFRAAFPGLAQALFTQVLMLCARLGMGAVGTVALDGTKIAAARPRRANRTEETLRKLAARRVAAHAAADAAEDELFGEGQRGDQVPPAAVAPGSRDERIARRAGRAGSRAAGRAGASATRRPASIWRPRQTGQAPGGQVPRCRAGPGGAVRLKRAEAAQRAVIAVR